MSSSLGDYRPDLPASAQQPAARAPGRVERGNDMVDWVDLVARLTPGELRVLAALIGDPGRTTSEAARLLCVSKSCIRFHLGNVYRKTGVRNKACLLPLCKELGFCRVARFLTACEHAAFSITIDSVMNGQPFCKPCGRYPGNRREPHEA